MTDTAALAAGTAPALRIPDLNDAFFVSSETHPEVSGRPIAGDLEFLIASQHQLDRPSGFAGDLCGRDAPVVGCKLAAESSTKPSLRPTIGD